MPNYMVQKLESGLLGAIKYYRKQSQPHVTHAESQAFTIAAQTDYSITMGVPIANIEVGTYRSGQGVPTGGVTRQI